MVSLSIQEGELFALLGVNGAGKTTLIKMLSCLTKPTSGDALLFGKSIITDPQQVKQLIAVSPQETAIAPNLTVRENLELMAGVHGFNKEKTNKKPMNYSINFRYNHSKNSVVKHYQVVGKDG